MGLPLHQALKDCPFCGVKAIIEDHGDKGWFVGCTNHPGSVHDGCEFTPSTWCDEFHEAIKAWNKRLLPQQSEAKV